MRNNDIEGKLNKFISNSIDKADNLTPGSKEREREVKNISILLDKMYEDLKFEEELLDKRHKMAHDEEIEQRKADIEEERIKVEAKAKNRVKPDTVVNCLSAVLVTGIGAVMEVNGYRLMKPFDLMKNFIARG